MRNTFVLFAVVAVAGVFLSNAGSSKGDKPLHTGEISASEFTGIWRGSEKCSGVDAPVSVIEIKEEGPGVFSITGLYSVKGKIAAEVKNNMLHILRQEVNDPNFKNLKIEGTLTLSVREKSLTGFIVVLNNDVRDDCIVRYQR